MSVGVFFVVISGGFETTVMKLIGVLSLWVIIATIIIIIITIVVLPFILLMSIFSSLNGGDNVNGDLSHFKLEDINDPILNKYKSVDFKNIDEIYDTMPKKDLNLYVTLMTSLNDIPLLISNHESNNLTNLKVLIVEPNSSEVIITNISLPSKNQTSLTLQKPFNITKMGLRLILENEKGVYFKTLFDPAQKPIVREEKGKYKRYCSDNDEGSKYIKGAISEWKDTYSSDLNKYVMNGSSFHSIVQYNGKSYTEETCVENQLYEFVCNKKDATREIKVINCENGCENGACIR